jgi:TctA family transporter
MILGPLAEAQMRNAVSIGEGSLDGVRGAAHVAHVLAVLIIIVLAVLAIHGCRGAELKRRPAFRRGRSLWCWNIR